MNMEALNKIGMVMQATGMGLKGQDGSAVYTRYGEEQEKAKRKEAIGGLMERLNIAGPKRDFLSTLPLEMQQEELWKMMNPSPVEGKVMGDRLVDPRTGKLIADFSPPPLDIEGLFGSPQANAIKTGLMARGIPEHVAQGFVANFNDESGLNPGINEQNPTVPGSRGGFGLAQWTGPRRKQLEAFAAQRGTSPDDMNTQLDFVVAELTGTESAAGASILSSPDASSAAQEIVSKYLRPAPEHEARRAAQYASLTSQIDKYTRALATGSGSEASREAVKFKRDELVKERESLAPKEAPSGFQALEMRAQAAGLKPGTEEYAQFMLSGGKNDELVIESDGQGGFTFRQGAAGSDLPKTTEGEKSAAGYLSRMIKAEAILDELSVDEPAVRSVASLLVAGTNVEGMVLSERQGRLLQAQRDWVRAKLRKESGAVIGQEEMAEEIRTYFPLPGEGAAQVEQKRQARKAAERQMEIMGGAASPQATGAGGSGSQGTPAQTGIVEPGERTEKALDDIEALLEKYGQ